MANNINPVNKIMSLILILLSILLLPNILFSKNIMKIDKLIVKSIKIDSANGFSFKNMNIIFNKRKDANQIIKKVFSNPRYSITHCESNNIGTGCVNIYDNEFKHIDKKGEE